MKNKYYKIFFYGIFLLQISLLIYFAGNAFTDGYNVRQAQTAIMTRSIVEDGFSIFPTRLTFFAPYTGNVILEFPILHSIAARIVYAVGESEFVLRLVNLLFHVFNVLIFYAILRRFFSSETTFFVLVLYISTPLVFYLAHAYMPETSMLSFYLLALAGFVWRDRLRFFSKISLITGLVLAPLAKPLAGLIYVPILFELGRESKAAFFRSLLFLGICALPFVGWMVYGTIVNGGSYSTGDNWGKWSEIFLNRGGLVSVWLDPDFYFNIISSIVFLNSTPFVLMLFALGFSSKYGILNFRFFRVWLLMVIFTIFLFAGANKGHPYYQVFLIPIFLIVGASYIENMLVGRRLCLKLKALISLGVISHLLLSFFVFFHGVNEKQRIYNLNEFKTVVENHISGVGKSNSSEFSLIHTKGMVSGVFDFYLGSHSRLYNPIGSESAIEYVKNQKSLGAKYFFAINTSYGNSIEALQEDAEFWNWLTANYQILHISESIVLVKF